MATRADFYTMDKDGKLILIGCTSNNYSGDFEEATNINDYLKSVRELMAENNSIEGKWYWPWTNSHITDEVFIFKSTPKWYNKNRGVLLSKVYVHNCPDTHLYFAKFDVRYSEKYQLEGGYYKPEHATLIELPVFEKHKRA